MSLLKNTRVLKFSKNTPLYSNPKVRFEDKKKALGARFVRVVGVIGDVLDAFQSILSEIEQILHFLNNFVQQKSCPFLKFKSCPQMLPLLAGASQISVSGASCAFPSLKFGQGYCQILPAKILFSFFVVYFWTGLMCVLCVQEMQYENKKNIFFFILLFSGDRLFVLQRSEMSDRTVWKRRARPAGRVSTPRAFWERWAIIQPPPSKQTGHPFVQPFRIIVPRGVSFMLSVFVL